MRIDGTRHIDENVTSLTLPTASAASSAASTDWLMRKFLMGCVTTPSSIKNVPSRVSAVMLNVFASMMFEYQNRVMSTPRLTPFTNASGAVSPAASS